MKTHSQSIWKRSLFVVISVLTATCWQAAPADAGLKIYYLRHAEAGHNVVREWRDVPKAQWPAYVGNANMLTPKGEGQAAIVAEKLAPYHFDAIACSPIWRCRQTVLPYLKRSERVAEIWPLLEEFSSIKGELTDRLPSERLFDGGPVLELPEEELNWFALPDPGVRRIKVASNSDDPEQHTADIHAVIARLTATIRERFAGTDQSILLVAHGNNGRMLLSALTSQEDRGEPENARLWMVEEQTDGRFLLRLYDDLPVEDEVTSTQPPHEPKPQ